MGIKYMGNIHTVIHVCRDLQYRGGVENFLFDFVQYNKDFKHLVIATEGNPGTRARKLNSSGIAVFYTCGSFWSKVRESNKIVSIYDRPILHVHLFRPEKLGVFVRGCLVKVTTKYSTYATDSQTGDRLTQRLFRFIENRVMDFIVTLFYKKVFIISNELESKWSFLGGRIARVALSTVRHFGEYRENRLLNESMVLMCATRMVNEKGHDLLIESLRKVPFSKLYLLGDGPLREQIKKHFSIVGLKDVEMLGALPREKVLEYMRKSDLMLLTSFTEGLPLLIQEAMSVGLVVVATNVGGNSELIDASVGRIVPSKTPCAFSDAIKSLIGKDVGEMGNRAIDRCKQHFSLSITIKTINKIYQEYIN